MAAGDTGITICSDALLMIGAKAITSFNDGTDESSICDRLYPDIRDSLLVMYPWSFSTKKIQLSRLLTTPGSVWKYAYQLPGDRLNNPRAVFESASVGAPVRKDWEIQGDQLLTNLEYVYIDYQYSVGEYAMPQYFVQLLKYFVAWHIAEALTDQSEKASKWQVIAVGAPAENGRGGFFRTAAQIDGQGNPSRAISDFTLVEARFG
jgi:hypothetical protein